MQMGFGLPVWYFIFLLILVDCITCKLNCTEGGYPVIAFTGNK